MMKQVLVYFIPITIGMFFWTIINDDDGDGVWVKFAGSAFTAVICILVASAFVEIFP